MAASSESRLIRVTFLHPIDVPGSEWCRYPRMETVCESFPKMGREAFDLRAVRVDGVPFVEVTSKSGMRELIPFGNVRQCTPWSEDAEKLLTPKLVAVPAPKGQGARP